MCDQILLHHHPNSPPHDDIKFMYRSVIIKLNYLAQCTRPGIVYSVHQCAHFSSNTCKDHTGTMEYTARYLKGTSELRLSFRPDISKSFECFSTPVIVETGPAHLPRRTHPLPSPAQVRLSHMQVSPSFGHISYRLMWPHLPLWLSTSLYHQR